MADGINFSLFMENNHAAYNRHAAYLYENPIRLIKADNPSDISKAIKQIKEAIDEGYHVAGWISYEAGLYFEDKLKELLPEENQVPYVHMGVFKGRKILNTDDAGHRWRKHESKSTYSVKNMAMTQSRDYYEAAFNKIQDYLRAGDIYQVNYTQKSEFDFEGSTEALYADLRNAQQVDYAAYIEADDFKVLSLSPELFIKKHGTRLTARPMKGTSKRGRTNEEDQKMSSTLFESEKERAENLMIVDLLRNDLSKFAKPGSVEVEKLYDVEKYRTLFTMTSTITAEVEEEHSAVDALMSIFPCGSVTGAPKIRAQQIISELEPHQRGIYTGAIGYFTPEGDMCFSVPIRTVTIDGHGKGELGIGSAIVADSIAENEYNECELKAKFLTSQHPRFDLIETMLCKNGRSIERLEQHLARLSASADYFSFICDVDEIRAALSEHLDLLDGDDVDVHKIRLLHSPGGKFSITSENINLDVDGGNDVVLSEKSTSSLDVHFFHKTTHRHFYKQEFDRYKALSGCRDVIFRNEKDQLTEGSYTNLFIEKDGVLYTPPIDCGLLNGVMRQSILDDASLKTEEKILYLEDLISADRVFLCNSVRGLVEVNFSDK